MEHDQSNGVSDLQKALNASQQFSITLRARDLGLVVMDWRQLFSLLFCLALEMAEMDGKPFSREFVEAEFLDLLDDPVNPLFETIRYVAEHLPEKLSSATADLVVEARTYNAAKRWKKDRLNVTAKFAELVSCIAERETNAALDRLSGKGPAIKLRKGRGQFSPWSDDDLIDVIAEAISVLRRKAKAQPRIAELRLLKYARVAKQLNTATGGSFNKGGDALRKLIKRRPAVAAHWLTEKAEWEAEFQSGQ